MLKKLFLLSFLAMAMLVFTSPLQATTVDGTSSGSFINPTGPSDMVVSGVGTSHFKWGTGVGTPPSALSFAGNSFSVETDQLFSFGKLSYYNGSIASGTEADTVDLNIQFSFTAPTGVAESFTYDLELINTTNSNDPYSSADYVSWTNGSSSSSFNADGVTYRLEFMGFGQIQGAGFASVDTFHVMENGCASAQLVGKVSVVPIPGALWIFASGLVGLVGLRRRKK